MGSKCCKCCGKKPAPKSQQAKAGRHKVEAGVQTHSHSTKKEKHRRDDASASGSKAVEIQTEPIVHVELTTGRQLPLDLVLCIDSSASMGELNFNKACRFLRRLLTLLEWPETRCALLRFHHKTEVLSHMSSDPWQADAALRQANFEAGETRFAPMLKASHDLMTENGLRAARRVILVLSDNDRPNDFHNKALAQRQDELEADGIRLLFLLAENQARSEFCCSGPVPVDQDTIDLTKFVEADGAEFHDTGAGIGEDITDVKEHAKRSATLEGDAEGFSKLRFTTYLHESKQVSCFFMSTFDVLCGPNPEGDEIVSELLQLLALCPRVVSRAKVLLPLEPPFMEVLESFTLEDDESEIMLGHNPIVKDVLNLKSTKPLFDWEKEEHIWKKLADEEAKHIAPEHQHVAVEAYPCWETAVLCGGDSGYHARAIARRDEQWYLRKVYEEDVPMSPEQNCCLGDIAGCSSPQKFRPLKPSK
eukprot:TRINITY_DN49154_c0_g1_i1.p1 TRINITY_DN49154_c0_g1~~TRINITY_DN49154_c0_g1_i1.p1  ORF type:complete len:476 (+),score=88.36 TRINITY_DN49154_c0_g1_i1:54-1481(+)